MTDQVREMLGFIPAIDREVWIKVGMALNSAYGLEGFPLFDDWSKSADNYNSRDARQVYKSFGDKGGITMGTLVHLARQYGCPSTMSTPPLSGLSEPVSLPPDRKPNEKKPVYIVGQPPLAVEYYLRLYNTSECEDRFVGEHQYATLKGIGWAAGARRGVASGKIIGRNADCLIVPIRNIETNVVQGVECINAVGRKQTFGHKVGGALILGNTLRLTEPWYVAEGWASSVSTVFHHKKNVCVCSFGKSSQQGVASLISQFYRPHQIFILREDDE
jgi:hypothetical protein